MGAHGKENEQTLSGIYSRAPAISVVQANGDDRSKNPTLQFEGDSPTKKALRNVAELEANLRRPRRVRILVRQHCRSPLESTRLLAVGRELL
jgi:hypothetical protein